MAVVVISRQVGSFGDEIAALVARTLGYQLIGQDEVHQLAESCDPEFKDAYAFFGIEVPKSFWERYFLNDPAYTSLFESLNYALASRGNVVILGRGAQIVLEDIPGVMKVRIVAPIMTRAKRIMEQQSISFEDALNFISHYGHQRRALIQQIYNKDLADWALYDVILNTESIQPKAATDILCQSVEKMDQPTDPEDLKKRLNRLAFAKLVESAVRKKVGVGTLRGIEVSSHEPGQVTISGYVSDQAEKDKAEQIAAALGGVSEVDNQLKIIDFKFYI